MVGVATSHDPTMMYIHTYTHWCWKKGGHGGTCPPRFFEEGAQGQGGHHVVTKCT